MSTAPEQVVIIGGGHNGLVAAFHLARAGLAPLVLERTGAVGGGVTTHALAPGFHVPTFTHDVSTVRQDIVREMGLDAHGLVLLPAHRRTCVLGEGTQPVIVSDDVAETVGSIGLRSRHDANTYAGRLAALARVSAVLASVFDQAAPEPTTTAPRDVWHLFTIGRRFRALPREDRVNLLRWMPMAVADLVDEWFELEALRVAFAARGLTGTMLGPRSAGSALVLLSGEAHRARGIRGVPRGGPAALALAMARAAEQAGARIRTRATVTRILVERDRTLGVVLENGDEVRAGVVLSAIDPKTTCLRLLDAQDLPPEFVWRMRNYRSSGTLAKLNLALSALPRFAGAENRESPAFARIHIGPDLTAMERAFDAAKHGACSPEPWLDVAIPSLLDQTLAPRGAHVLSAYVHYAPYAPRQGWDSERTLLRTAALSQLERFAPGISRLIVAEQLLTPVEIERECGTWGGHIFHGEIAFDQLAFFRPTVGATDYRSPIRGLYLASAGTHPGGWVSGQSGRLAAKRVLGDTSSGLQ